MLEFTKRECVNEYSVWCTEEDDLVGKLWYNEEKGGISHLLNMAQVITLTICRISSTR